VAVMLLGKGMWLPLLPPALLARIPHSAVCFEAGSTLLAAFAILALAVPGAPEMV
jgi:hypothetical protein